MEKRRRTSKGVLVLLLAIAVVFAAGKDLWLPSVRNPEGSRAFWTQTSLSCFSTLLKGHYPSGRKGENGKNLSEFLWDWIPAYRLGKRYLEKKPGMAGYDPAYQGYLENQQVYEQYAAIQRARGDEDADSACQGQQEPAGTENSLEPASGPVLSIPGKQYSMEQLADYDFLMKTFYSVHPSTTAGREEMNAKELLSRDLTLTKSGETPQILIYHSHSQETYSDYSEANPDATVVGVGNYLTELLTAKGYQVIHDTSVYDLRNGELDRSKAYTYALEGISQILQQNPSIEVVLDIHRDGVDQDTHLVSQVNGKSTAQIMFFNGMSQTPDGPIEYLPNPYREDNLAFSLQMQVKAAAYFPGFTRKIYLKGLRYNLHVRPRSALIEVGAQTNTYEEARNAMEPLAEVLDMVLQGN